MKIRFLITILLAMVLIIPVTGCKIGNAQLQDVAEKLGGVAVRTAVYYIAINNPTIIEPGIASCRIILAEGALDENIKAEMEKMLLAYQTEKFKLPPTVTIFDLMDIIESLGVKAPELQDAPFDTSGMSIPAVKLVAKEILRGLQTAKTLNI